MSAGMKSLDAFYGGNLLRLVLNVEQAGPFQYKGYVLRDWPTYVRTNFPAGMVVLLSHGHHFFPENGLTTFAYASERAKLIEANLPTSVVQTVGVDSALQKIFNGLAKKWKDETRSYSVTSQKYAHQAYQSILVLGPEVVPLILRDLKANGGRWFEALKALTKRDDIAKPDDSYEDAVKAWLAWGKSNKLIE
jgi:hypothetical protein